jgi:hypothetical protein
MLNKFLEVLFFATGTLIFAAIALALAMCCLILYRVLFDTDHLFVMSRVLGLVFNINYGVKQFTVLEQLRILYWIFLRKKILITFDKYCSSGMTLKTAFIRTKLGI